MHRMLILVALLFATSAFAATGISEIQHPQVTIPYTEKPVAITSLGQAYVAPAGTPSDTQYFTYTQGGYDFICARSNPPELFDINPSNVMLQLNGLSISLSCYPANNFIVE